MMTHIHDEAEEDQFSGFDDEDGDLDFDDTGFADFDKKGGSGLADLWANNTAFKIGAIIAGVVGMFLVFSLLGGEEEQEAGVSRVGRTADIAATPGTRGASQSFVEAVVDQNTERLENAITSGGSAIPTPIDNVTGGIRLPGTDDETEAINAESREDPLARWQRLQEERLAREQAEREKQERLDAEKATRQALLAAQQAAALTAAQQAGATLNPGSFANATQPAGASLNPTSFANAVPSGELSVQNIANNADINTLTQSMTEQMQSILNNKSTVPIQTLSLTDPSYLERLFAKEEQEAQEQAQAAAEAAAQGEILLPAGEIAYAQLLIEANSDVPGPILAEIVSGPLAGSRVLGSFQVNRELLTLNFNTIVIDDKSIGISAIAVDPATTSTGMATDVDHHYLQRIILPMAARFIEGMASAAAETGLLEVTVEGDTVSSEQQEASDDQQVAAGIDEAGQELGEILNDIADDLEVTVIVAAGTPMGLLFTAPVVEGGAPPEAGQAATANASAPSANPLSALGAL